MESPSSSLEHFLKVINLSLDKFSVPKTIFIFSQFIFSSVQLHFQFLPQLHPNVCLWEKRHIIWPMVVPMVYKWFLNVNLAFKESRMSSPSPFRLPHITMCRSIKWIPNVALRNADCTFLAGLNLSVFMSIPQSMIPESGSSWILNYKKKPQHVILSPCLISIGSFVFGLLYSL